MKRELYLHLHIYISKDVLALAPSKIWSCYSIVLVANRAPEFFLPRRLRGKHLYLRKMSSFHNDASSSLQSKVMHTNYQMKSVRCCWKNIIKDHLQYYSVFLLFSSFLEFLIQAPSIIQFSKMSVYTRRKKRARTTLRRWWRNMFTEEPLHLSSRPVWEIGLSFIYTSLVL